MRESDASDRLAPYSALDLAYYLPDDILTKVDRMSMAHSLEVRAPFLDYRVIELAGSMPWDWKISPTDSKVILKDAFAADLPAGVLRPRKRGFSIPTATWLRGELRGAVEDALSDQGIRESGIFDMAELRGLWDEHRTGARDRKNLIWSYLFFARWWRKNRA